MLRRIASLLICIAAAISAGSETPASAATRHVVMLFDERLELPGPASIEADFVDALVYNSPDKNSHLSRTHGSVAVRTPSLTAHCSKTS